MIQERMLLSELERACFGGMGGQRAQGKEGQRLDLGGQGL